MTRFAALDLAQIAPPDIIDPLNYELILDELVSDFKIRFTDYDVDALESDPVKKVLEVFAMRELDLRARVNDAARAVMLATAGLGDLDNLAALYRTRRLIIGTQPDSNEPIYEDDTAFRYRVSLAPEAFSTCGAEGAYKYFALTGDGETRTATDAQVAKPEAGHVTVYIMGVDGEPTIDEIKIVRAALNQTSRLPMTDYITVAAATKRSFDVIGTLVIPAGPDAVMMTQKSVAGINEYAKRQRKLGGEITISALNNAGFVGGASAFRIAEPFENIPAVEGQFPEINLINIEAEIQ